MRVVATDVETFEREARTALAARHPVSAAAAVAVPRRERSEEMNATHEGGAR
jgi:hypothetical protein